MQRARRRGSKDVQRVMVSVWDVGDCREMAGWWGELHSNVKAPSATELCTKNSYMVNFMLSVSP